jgi:hypothetical protein
VAVFGKDSVEHVVLGVTRVVNKQENLKEEDAG